MDFRTEWRTNDFSTSHYIHRFARELYNHMVADVRCSLRILRWTTREYDDDGDACAREKESEWINEKEKRQKREREKDAVRVWGCGFWLIEHTNKFVATRSTSPWITCWGPMPCGLPNFGIRGGPQVKLTHVDQRDYYGGGGRIYTRQTADWGEEGGPQLLIFAIGRASFLTGDRTPTTRAVACAHTRSFLLYSLFFNLQLPSFTFTDGEREKREENDLYAFFLFFLCLLLGTLSSWTARPWFYYPDAFDQYRSLSRFIFNLLLYTVYL